MITLLIRWYDRKTDDFTPDYDSPHTGRIKGATPDECMFLYRQWCLEHDLARYTRSEIIEIY
jgi:hypothetical protein